MAVPGEQHVSRLDVAVDNPLRVNVVDGGRKLREPLMHVFLFKTVACNI